MNSQWDVILQRIENDGKYKDYRKCPINFKKNAEMKDHTQLMSYNRESI